MEHELFLDDILRCAVPLYVLDDMLSGADVGVGEVCDVCAFAEGFAGFQALLRDQGEFYLSLQVGYVSGFYVAGKDYVPEGFALAVEGLAGGEGGFAVVVFTHGVPP